MQVRVAIIGSGLSASILCSRLAARAHVTVYERGPAVPQLPENLTFSVNRFGLKSFWYGLGGTTALWQGGLLALSEEEMAGSWPKEVVDGLRPFLAPAVDKLYGRQTASWWWNDRGASPGSRTIILDGLFRPKRPFRAAQSGFFDGVDLRLNQVVRSVHEREGVVYVKTNTDEDAFDLVVLAAGAINSPLILRRSKIGGPNVGRNLTDHPMGFIAKITKNREMNRFDEMSLRSNGMNSIEPMLKIKDPINHLWTSFVLRPTSHPFIHSDPYRDSFDLFSAKRIGGRVVRLLTKMRDADFRHQVFSHLFRQRASGEHRYVLAQCEQEPSNRNFVSGDEDGSIEIGWEMSGAMIDGALRSLHRFADWVGGSVTLPPDGNIKSRLWSGAHHSGTCRITSCERDGVADTDLRVHGTTSVYVCDGSVLPSTGASNTGLTIAALALRLGDWTAAWAIRSDLHPI